MRQWVAGLMLACAVLIGAWGVWDSYQHQLMNINALQHSLTQQHLQIAQLNDRLVALDRQQRQQPEITEAATQLSVQSTRQSILLLLQLAQQHVDHGQMPQAMAQLEQLRQQLAQSSLDPIQREQLNRVISADISALKQQHQQQQRRLGLQDHAIARLQDLIQENAKTLPQAHTPQVMQHSSWQTQLQGVVRIREAEPKVWMDLQQRSFICYQTLIVLGQIRRHLPEQQPDTMRRLWQSVDEQLAQLSDGQSVHARQLAQQLAQLAMPAPYPLQSLQVWQADREVVS